MPLPKPHRKLVKHFDERGDIHELTFSCYQRLPILDNEWFAGNADVTSY